MLVRPLPKTVAERVSRKLYLNPSHPIGIVRSKVEDYFCRQGGFIHYAPPLSPIVSVSQSFDDLLIAPDHPSRSPSDTFYVSPTEVLRPQATAYQAAALAAAQAAGVSAAVWTCDVYRRDEIDRTHFPVFHQTDGAKIFPANETGVIDDLCGQLEGLVRELWGGGIEMRWDKAATFPFTDPSLELEMRLPGRDDWVECLGCGEIRKELLPNGQRGWAFGIGLERFAMLLFGVEDIRLFWSEDPRFLSQFRPGEISRYIPFSTFPAVTRDISFWAGTGFEANAFFEQLRDTAGGCLESVKLVDEFKREDSRSLCYRLEYRGVDHHLTHEEVNAVQARVLTDLAKSQLSVVLR
jgi:phenylalanyl-tRNA synthetase alpha chain